VTGFDVDAAEIAENRLGRVDAGSAAPFVESAGVSVVIPAHNYAHYLPSAIDSILAQVHTNLEVIVVDDGSADNTREVVSSYVDPRVRYIWQENAGLSAARNTGIRHARMKYVGFLDADDRWLPGFLESVMAQFAKLGGSFAAIASVSDRIDEHGKLLPGPKFSYDCEREFTVRDFIMRNRPLSSSIVIRSEVFEECGYFDTSLRSSEDRDMWIRITTRHRFWLIGMPLALIRRHGANMSKNAVRMKKNSAAVLWKAWNAEAVPRSNLLFWLRAFSVHYFQIAWTHFDAGLRLHAFLYLGASALLWPIFLDRSRLYEPPFFRVRTLIRFCLRLLQGGGH